MPDKPLDVLSATAAEKDAVDAAFETQVAVAKEFFRQAGTAAQGMSDASAIAGQAAINARYANDPRLAAVLTIQAILSQQWPQVSSAPIPPIYTEAPPAQVTPQNA